VVTLFDRGATAEEIAQSFPSLSLGEVYAVLSYVVARRAEVETTPRAAVVKTTRHRRTRSGVRPGPTFVHVSSLVEVQAPGDG
jgi:hypothetical protein